MGHRLWWSAVAVLLLLGGVAAFRHIKSYSQCRPTYRVLRAEALEVPVGQYWRFHIEPVLIGCSSDLVDLQDRDLAKIEDGILEFVQKYHITLLQQWDEKEVREEACKNINKGIPGSPVSDVYFKSISFAESRPTPQ